MRYVRVKQEWGSRRGSATVLALMVSLLLMVLISGTMALTIADTETTRDYTRNRASFEASDSGIQHGRKEIVHALDSWHLPSSTTLTDLANYRDDATSGVKTNNKDISLIRDTATNLYQVMPRGSTATTASWNGGAGPNGSYDVSYDITPNGVTAPASGDISATQQFHYNYTLTSKGHSDIQSQHSVATRKENGSFDIQVSRPSFATYGYFTDSLKNQYDQQLWFYDGEVYDGPTHVNAAPPTGQAAFWGHTVFKGAFSAVQEAYEDSVFAGGANPDFQGGASWGVDRIDVPQNGWNQLRASVGDLGNIDNQSAPTNQELRQDLGLTVNSSAVPPGVYYSGNSNTGTDLLGGLLVNGDASNIKFSKSGNEQIVAITMNNASGPFAGTHTWTVHDNAVNHTSYVVYDNGTPQNFNSSFNGVIQVQGNINQLDGDGSASSADIESNHQVTLSATGDVYIHDNITYQDDPRTNQNAKNILGIFSSNGNVYLSKTAPNNLQVNASVMAASANHGVGAEGITTGGGSYDYTYPNKGNWNLLGGLIEAKNQTTGVFYSDGTLTGYKWNFTYDTRFQSGVAPPYFPYVSKFVLQMMGVQAKGWSRNSY